MFPKTGNKLHGHISELDLAKLMAHALDAELGSTHRAVKTVMRWTGASERAVKHWFAGTHAPHGCHLVDIIRHSDQALGELLLAAGRDDLIVAIELVALRKKMLEMIELIDVRLPGQPS